MFESISIQDIDQEWAWSQLVGRAISIGKRHKYCSPLRADSKPGVWFEYYNSILLIVDFSDKSNSHINCVTAWSRIKGIHWRKALYEIYDKQGVRVIKKVEVKEVKKEKTISITECWTKEHEKFWSNRTVDRTKTFGVQSYTIVSERTRTVIVDELCFAFKYADGKYKLYFPNNKEYRFYSNLKPNEVWLNYVNNSVLISKGHKDYQQIFPLWEHSLTMIQSENSWYDMVLEWSTYGDKLVFFDNDLPGLKNAYELTKQIEGLFTFIPTVDALSIIQKFPEDFRSYLPSNLSNLVDSFMCDNCTDNLEVAGYPLYRLSGLKDFDNLRTSDLDYKKIFKWLTN